MTNVVVFTPKEVVFPKIKDRFGFSKGTERTILKLLYTNLRSLSQMVKTPMKAGNLYTTVHGLGCVSDATFKGNPQPPRTLEFLETSEGLGPSKMVVSSWTAGHIFFKNP